MNLQIGLGFHEVTTKNYRRIFSMKRNEKFDDLENKIRSLPEPDYDKKFT
jgi:hypothetical protein